MSAHVEWVPATAEMRPVGPGAEMPDGQCVDPGKWALVASADDRMVVVEGTIDQLLDFAVRVRHAVMDARLYQVDARYQALTEME